MAAYSFLNGNVYWGDPISQPLLYVGDCGGDNTSLELMSLQVESNCTRTALKELHLPLDLELIAGFGQIVNMLDLRS